MDRYHSSVIFKGSSTASSIPNSTQHDARQRCPALIVPKEEKKTTTTDCDTGLLTVFVEVRVAPLV